MALSFRGGHSRFLVAGTMLEPRTDGIGPAGFMPAANVVAMVWEDPEAMPARTRCVALVGSLTGERKTTHTGRFPAIAPEKMLPVADVLLIVVDDEPGVMLFRYTAHGEHAGDTWHETFDAARAQAEYEFGDALVVPWIEVADDVTDAHEFAVKYAHERLKDRGRWP